MILQLLTVSILASFTNGNQNVTRFTPEEIAYFESLKLCIHFGGECGLFCPFRFIRHRWHIPLCRAGLECCYGPPTEQELRSMANSTSSPPNTTITASTTTTMATSIVTDFPPATNPWPSQTHQEDSCGLAPSARNSRRKRIVGGSLATPGSWPWLVALRSMMGSHACSGALVARRWIVTAAHCFKYISNPILWRVRIGEYNLLQVDDGERDISIDTIILHPGYRTQRGEDAENQTLYTQYVNDIALVHLSEEVSVEPICLPGSQEIGDEGHGQCWVAGWGITMDQMNDDQRLRQVTGPVIPNDMCGQMWSSHLLDSMMCFGDGTYGPCAGDSGGPLSCQGPSGRYTLEGVVSWGTEDCNLSGYPAVFTRVRPFLTWVRDNMGMTTAA